MGEQLYSTVHLLDICYAGILFCFFEVPKSATLYDSTTLISKKFVLEKKAEKI